MIAAVAFRFAMLVSRALRWNDDCHFFNNGKKCGNNPMQRSARRPHRKRRVDSSGKSAVDFENSEILNPSVAPPSRVRLLVARMSVSDMRDDRSRMSLALMRATLLRVHAHVPTQGN